MLTKGQKAAIKRAINYAQKNIDSSKDEKRYFYYCGQIDGINGLLEQLGVNLED